MSRVRAGLFVSAGVLAITVAASCGSTPPSRLEFVSITPNPPRLGDTTTVTFKATDSRGLPLEGALIRFSLETPGGVPAADADAGTDAGVSELPGVTLHPREAATLEQSGEVHVTLVATTRVSTVVVVATSEDGTVVARSLPISFAGTTGSGRQLTFQCGPLSGAASGGIHGISAYDGSRHMIAGVKLDCFAHVADRNGDGVPGAQVSFLSEAGHIDPTATTTAEVVANARVQYKTALPLPLDVDPTHFTWEVNDDATHTGQFRVPLWMEPWNWKSNPIADYNPASPMNPPCLIATDCPEPRRPDPLRPPAPSPEARTLNPRDNLVTLIAVTRGEEGYTDSNNNGQFDEGEAFDDLTEPFVDMNDSGTREDFEPFIDANNDKLWNGKNGVFDGSTLIWVEEKILWTGYPLAPYDTSGATPTVRILEPDTAAEGAIPHNGAVYASMLMSDPWFNAIASNDVSDGCVLNGPASIVPSPEKFGGGIRMTYPSADLIEFAIRDAHDPNGDPPPAAYPAPVPWRVTIACEFTASPNEGHKVIVNINGPTGTVL